MTGGVLVTGGAGFIGSHLVDLLVEAGERALVFDDLSRGRREWLHPKALLREGDVRDDMTVRASVQELEPDVIVHLVAAHFIPAVEGAPHTAREVNVGGTRRLLDALAERPPRVILFASTAAVYPDRAGPIAETCTPAPTDLYGETKLEGERLVSEFADRTGTQCVIARIFNVIGTRETNPHVVPDLVTQLRNGMRTVRLGNLQPRRDYTDVRDVATALQKLLSAPSRDHGIFNVGSGRSTSVEELVHTCEDVLNRSIDVEVEPRRARTRDRLELVADVQLLRQTTGWQPLRSLQETLDELLHAPESG
jgi:UDP-glucose 4-epimerase